MDIIDIGGKELHFLRMTLNWQLYQGCYTLEMLLNPPEHVQWSKEFIYNCEKKGFIRFEGNKIYVTDEAIRSINEKDKRESRLIEEYIIDDFEYAFLMFMDNRNEPVPILDFPPNFKYHSKIDGQPVPGSTNSFYDWMTEVEKYVDNPTIDGFILNYTGKKRFEKLKREKELKVQNEKLDIEMKKQTITGTKFARITTYALLFITGISVFIPLYIWHQDKDDVKKTRTEMPQLERVIHNQEQIQQSIQSVQQALQNLDTSLKKIKIVKH